MWRNQKVTRESTQIAFFHEIPTVLTVAGATVVTACVVASGARTIVDKRATTSPTLRKALCLKAVEERDAKPPA